MDLFFFPRIIEVFRFWPTKMNIEFGFYRFVKVKKFTEAGVNGGCNYDSLRSGALVCGQYCAFRAVYTCDPKQCLQTRSLASAYLVPQRDNAVLLVTRRLNPD